MVLPSALCAAAIQNAAMTRDNVVDTIGNSFFFFYFSRRLKMPTVKQTAWLIESDIESNSETDEKCCLLRSFYFFPRAYVKICFDIRLARARMARGVSAARSCFPLRSSRASRKSTGPQQIQNKRGEREAGRRAGRAFRQKSLALKITRLPRQSNVRLNDGNNYYHTENTENVAAVYRRPMYR